ncbi:MAG TPA: hypothetical protein VI076_05430 [Actinopolymorphaceae bacterium]
MTETVPTSESTTGREDTGLRPDVIAILGGVGLIAVAAVVGAVAKSRGIPIEVISPPLLAWFQPHVGASTPLAVAVAVVIVTYGPSVASRLSWRPLLFAAWGSSLAWVMSLALVDGWYRFGWRLGSRREYLHEVPTAPPWSELLPGFAERIAADGPERWTTHVAGHPPGALAFFMALDQIGLRGGYWAAAAVVLIGTSAVVAIALTVKVLDDESLARRALPFVVLTPAAIWIAVSADAMFMGVTAWAVTLLAYAGKRRDRLGDLLALASGLLFAAILYLSYGLVLAAFLAGAVLLATRRIRPGLIAGVVVIVAVALVALGGFWWWEGLQQLHIRYYQGVGGVRPYAYWVWGNLAAALVCAGPVVAAGLRRSVLRVRARGIFGGTAGVSLLVVGALAAMLVASLSGLSKSEVERIWLPFTVWLLPSCALLPTVWRRWFLGLQALAALLVQHILLTNW